MKALAIVLGLCAVAAVISGLATHSVTAQPKPGPWPMTTLEKQASRAVAAHAALVRVEIARIASGDEALAAKIYAVAASIQALDRDNDELVREAKASRRLDVALVDSGGTWVIQSGSTP